MKKTLPIAIIATSLLGLGSLTSCQDEDFDVSTAVLQERAFEQNFIKEFGKPSANQSWDFYSQAMQALRQNDGATRATMDGEEEYYVTLVDQPKDDAALNALISEWHDVLPESVDNHAKGQNSYTLISTGGEFQIYAVRYAGGIEVDDDYDLDFGIIYKDLNTNTDITKSLFKTGFNTDADFKPTERHPDYPTLGILFGNPGWGAKVKLPKGTPIRFYLSYRPRFNYNYWNYDNYPEENRQTLYSDQPPVFIQRRPNDNGGWSVAATIDYETATTSHPVAYGGMSTLLYSDDHISSSTNLEEEIMIIGIEDAFGHNGSNGTINFLDYDFNDIVLYIKGDFPEPTSKRFFTEDKKQFDYDYNDVVFDLINTGIVLRAVGGTLPVFLRITDKKGNTTDTQELHELLKSKQKNQNIELTYETVVNGEKKTFYKPINVGSDPGLTLDPQPIVFWTETAGTRLSDDDVEKFASDPSFRGNVKLIVLSEYSSNGYDLSNVETLEYLLDEPGTPTIIKMANDGEIPSMWTGSVTVNWMKELTKITKGYPDFYGGENKDGKQWWTNKIPGWVYSTETLDGN